MGSDFMVFLRVGMCQPLNEVRKRSDSITTQGNQLWAFEAISLISLELNDSPWIFFTWICLYISELMFTLHNGHGKSRLRWDASQCLLIWLMNLYTLSHIMQRSPYRGILWTMPMAMRSSERLWLGCIINSRDHSSASVVVLNKMLSQKQYVNVA